MNKRRKRAKRSRVGGYVWERCSATSAWLVPARKEWTAEKEPAAHVTEIGYYDERGTRAQWAHFGYAPDKVGARLRDAPSQHHTLRHSKREAEIVLRKFLRTQEGRSA